MQIYLVPLKFANNSLLEALKYALTDIFNAQIIALELPVEMEEAYSHSRGQYYSTQLISNAITHTENLTGKVVLLLEFDLFVPIFTYVFGEAQLGGKHAVVSVCRLHEEFYSGLSNDQLLYERALKELLHELGHCFGLLHCKDWDCVMHQSQGIEEVDLKGAAYCIKCSSELRLYLK